MASPAETPEVGTPLLGTAPPTNRRNQAIIGLAVVVAVVVGYLIFSGGTGQKWQATSGPGHPLALLAVNQHPGEIVAGTEQGQVLVTTDGGQTWTPQQGGLPAGVVVSSLLILPDGSRLYTGTNQGIFTSTDEGAHWSVLGQGLPNDTVESLALGSSDGQILLAGTPDHGVYTTRDGGQSWQPASQGLPAKVGIYALTATANEDHIYAGLIGGGIAVTANQGQTWTVSAAGLPAQTNVFSIAIAPATTGTPAHFYAGTNVGLFTSTDGITWKVLGSGLGQTRVLSIAIDPISPTLLVAGTDAGVSQSTDGGQTWKAIASGLPGGTSIGAVAISRSANTQGVVYAAGDHIYRFPGQGSTTAFGALRLLFIAVLVGLVFWVTTRQNRLIRAMLPTNEPPPGALPRFRGTPPRPPMPSHIRGSGPPLGGPPLGPPLA